MGATPCQQRPCARPLACRQLSALTLRTPVVLLVVLALAVVSAVGGFLSGRYRAQAQLAGLTATQAHNESLQRALLESQGRESALVSERSGLVAERAEAARVLAQTQAQLAREAQDAAFFRAIATAGADAPVSIQRLRIRAVAGRRYHLSLVLARPLGREEPVSGTGSLVLEGSRAGQPLTLQMGQVAVDKSAKWVFNYRTLQAIEVDVELPEGYTPDRLIVELSPAKPGVAGLRQAFLWQISPV